MIHTFKKHGHHLALLFLSLLIAYWFWPEFKLATLFYNDGVNHISIIKMMDEVWKTGGNVVDFWLGHINLGHAMLRSYQFLMHLMIWIAHKTIFAGLPIEKAFNLCVLIAATLLPWSYYKGARLFGATPLTATVFAWMLCLVRESTGYGFGLTNYTFSGFGTYNQLFAALFLPLALGGFHRAIRGGGGAFVSGLAFAATLLCHILVGYFAAIWLGIDFAIAAANNRKKKKSLLKPAGVFAGSAFLWSANWLIPMFQDRLLQHHSAVEAANKWTGLGAEAMLKAFFEGDLLDNGRVAVITILACIGALWPLWNLVFKRRSHCSPLLAFAGVQSFIWLLISFGPLTWGPLLTSLPMGSQVHWHRAFAMTQVAFALSAALFFSHLLVWLSTPRKTATTIGAGLVALACAYPCVMERQNFFRVANAHWLQDTKDYWEEPSMGYREALAFAAAHSDARWAAGSPWNWGQKLLVTSYIPFYGLLTQFNIENVGAIYHHQNHTESASFKISWADSLQAELMNVRYLALTPEEAKNASPRFKEILKTKTGILFDNQNTSGYFMTGRLGSEGCIDNDALIRATEFFLKSPMLYAKVFPKMTLAKSCPLESALEAKLTRDLPAARAPTGEVLSSGRDAKDPTQKFHAAVQMQSEGLVVFKMNYHPNWVARVDGKITPTFMTLPAFNALQLSPGKHQIEFHYESDFLKRFLGWATLVCLLLYGALCGLRPLLKRRRRVTI